MKKTSSITGFVCVSALFLLLLSAGCASTKIALSEYSPAAVISVTGTNLVMWQSESQDSDEDDSDNILTGMANRILDSRNPEIETAVDRLDYADESFRRIAGEISGLAVLPKESVVDSDIYKYSYRSLFNVFSDSTCATEYKDMTVIGAKRARVLAEGIGAKSLVAMDFNFKKALARGTRHDGQVAAAITMKIKLTDEKGHEAVNKEYSKISKNTTPIKGGYYDKKVLVSLINETIDDLITQFAIEFTGNLNGENDFKADGENAKTTVEENQDANDASTSGASAPQASAKLGKPKSMQ